MIEREILPDGLTLLFEEIPGVQSAALGVWLRMGSRHEPTRLSGICHFLEHLVFKGTETRTAREISLLTDRIGGNIDAFTTKETTTFYARVLDEHLPIAIDLLSDIVRRPRFDAEEMERERRVILEEIRMVMDSPEERLYDLFAEKFWAGHPLGRPIQGTEDSVSKMSRKTVLNFFRQAYVPPNLVVSAAGKLSKKNKQRIRDAFSGLAAGKRSETNRGPKFKPGIALENKKEMEQVHLLLGLPGLSSGDESRFTLHMLNTVLGGSISSRLFRRIRDERGLVYSVGSNIQAHEGGGLINIYAATSPDKVQEVIDISMEELRNLAQHAPSKDEVEVARDHLKGNTLLSLESTSSRMSRMAREEMVLGRSMSTQEILERLHSAGPSEIQEMAARLFRGPVAVAAVGRTSKLKLNQKDMLL
ncbi:MAG: pitrilysin family protein [Acidobacteriota bacterium]